MYAVDSVSRSNGCREHEWALEVQMTVKERVLRAVQALPDGATPDDVLAQLRSAVAGAGQNGASNARTAPGQWGSALAYLESAATRSEP